MAGPILAGIEIGGTKLQVGLGRGDGAILALRRREVDRGAGASGILNAIHETFDSLSRESGVGRPSAAGIGFGGPIDATRGVVLRSNHVAGWDGFPLAAWAREHLRVPIAVLHNDSDAAALGEALHGAGRGASPVLYVNSGSGVGGGLVVEGRIYRGAGRGSIEIGHTILGDPLLGVGPTLEGVASGWAIERAAREAVEAGRVDPDSALGRFAIEGGRLDGSLIGVAAGSGEPVSSAILRRAAVVMGSSLAFAVNLLAPERVVLGGGVSQLPESLWLGPIREAALARVYEPLREDLRIVGSELGQDVVVHGALALAREAWNVLAAG
jgi:glucokinase